jgi:hypothetical protein
MQLCLDIEVKNLGVIHERLDSLKNEFYELFLGNTPQDGFAYQDIADDIILQFEVSERISHQESQGFLYGVTADCRAPPQDQPLVNGRNLEFSDAGTQRVFGR